MDTFEATFLKCAFNTTNKHEKIKSMNSRPKQVRMYGTLLSKIVFY